MRQLSAVGVRRTEEWLLIVRQVMKRTVKDSFGKSNPDQLSVWCYFIIKFSKTDTDDRR